jgi:dTMP kinase
MARAVVRGVDQQWMRRLYGFAPAPHLVFYLNIDADKLARRVLENGGISYWESGMDMKSGDDIYDNFRSYQRRLLKAYASMADEYGFRQIDGRKSVTRIQTELRRQVAEFLEISLPPSATSPRARRVTRNLED